MGYYFRSGRIVNTSRELLINSTGQIITDHYQEEGYGFPLVEDKYYLPLVFTDSVMFTGNMRLCFYIPKNVTSLILENFSETPPLSRDFTKSPYLKIYYADTLPGEFTEYSAEPLIDSNSGQEFSFITNDSGYAEDGYLLTKKGF